MVRVGADSLRSSRRGARDDRARSCRGLKRCASESDRRPPAFQASPGDRNRAQAETFSLSGELQMKFATFLFQTQPSSIASVARKAEDLDFESLWIPEHIIL